MCNFDVVHCKTQYSFREASSRFIQCESYKEHATLQGCLVISYRSLLGKLTAFAGKSDTMQKVQGITCLLTLRPLMMCSAGCGKRGGRAAAFCRARARSPRGGEDNPNQEPNQTLHAPECRGDQGSHNPHLRKEPPPDLHRMPSGKLP